MGGGRLMAVFLVTLVAVCLGGVALGAGVLASAMPGTADAATQVDDIPPAFLEAYRASAERFELGDDGWAYLAGIGKVESDHGRSNAPGVRDGQNAHGCCAGPMQIHNGFGTGGGTWGAFKVDGDADGREDIYDPDDAVATAARYLRFSGAPGDWHRALFAYNRAEWYIGRVVDAAARYLEAARPAIDPVSAEGSWLAALPGFPGERCDRRIVADVLALVRRWGIVVSDCFGGGPHAAGGEHPLGLAVDVSPRNGDWSRTERLARAAGWDPSCAASGCAGRGPFRVVLYNGYPGHGDPGFSHHPHLHLSWNHGPATPFSPAPWVQTLLHPGRMP